MKPQRAAVAAVFLVLPVLSSASEALADQHGCLNCHAIERRVLGPSFKEVAEKYRRQPGAEEAVLGRVAAGGVGLWGRVPMPGMAHVPADDLRAIVAWLLKT